MLDTKNLACLKTNCQNITFCESQDGVLKKEKCGLFSEMKTSIGLNTKKPAVKKITAKEYYSKKENKS